MANLVLLRNPLQPFEREHHIVTGNFLKWLRAFAPDGFGGITKLYRDGKEINIDYWDFEVTDDDFLVLAISPAGGVIFPALLQILVTALVSAVINRLFIEDIRPQNPAFADPSEENTVYSLTAKQNAARIGGEIPVNYGNPITTPDYASQPYTEFTTIDIDALSSGSGTYILVETRIIAGTPYEFILVVLPLPGNYEIWESDDGAGSGAVFVATINPVTTIDPTTGVTKDYIEIRDVDDGGAIVYSWFWNNTYDYEMRPDGGDVLISGLDRERGDGEQYLYYLLSLGLGEHDIEAIYLADSDSGDIVDDSDNSLIDWMDFPYSNHGGNQGWISAFFNIAYPDPGLFHENVFTSVEVGSQAFEGPLTSAYFPLGNKNVEKIFIDLSFDRGFYRLNDLGEFQNHGVRFVIYVKNRVTGGIAHIFQVDWATGSDTKSISPLRRTLYFDVTLGLYSVAVSRVSPKSSDAGRTQDSFRWVGLRAWISVPNFPNYSKSHILAMRLRASEYISQQAQSRVRVKLKRRIPNLDNSALVDSNNVALIVKDIFTNTDYGGGRPVSELDMDLLTSLYNRWQSAGVNYGFSGVFNGASTIYEGLKTVLAVGAAQVLPIGSQLSFWYDGVKPVRTQLFTTNNIQRDTLRMNYNFDRVGAFDGVTLEYRDDSTWQPAFIVEPPGAVNTQRISLFGCNNATLAQSYAEYFWARRTQQRVGVEFQTELEGLICRGGDRIGVSHWLVTLAASGLIHDYNAAGLLLTIDREIEAFADGTRYIILRDEYGAPTEPIPVNWVSATELLITDATNLNIVIYTAFEQTPTHFTLGEAAKVVRDFVVTEITHDGDLIVTVRGENYIDDYSDFGLPYLDDELT